MYTCMRHAITWLIGTSQSLLQVMYRSRNDCFASLSDYFHFHRRVKITWDEDDAQYFQVRGCDTALIPGWFEKTCPRRKIIHGQSILLSLFEDHASKKTSSLQLWSARVCQKRAVVWADHHVLIVETTVASRSKKRIQQYDLWPARIKNTEEIDSILLPHSLVV